MSGQAGPFGSNHIESLSAISKAALFVKTVASNGADSAKKKRNNRSISSLSQKSYE